MNIFALGISHHFSCNFEISLRELFALVIALRSVMVHSCVQVFVKRPHFYKGYVASLAEYSFGPLTKQTLLAKMWA